MRSSATGPIAPKWYQYATSTELAQAICGQLAYPDDVAADSIGADLLQSPCALADVATELAIELNLKSRFCRSDSPQVVMQMIALAARQPQSDRTSPSRLRKTREFVAGLA